MREKCRKYKEKIQRLQNKKTTWKKEMMAWYSRYRDHPDFSGEHPEMIKYEKMKKKVQDKMARLQGKYFRHVELLNYRIMEQNS